MANMWEEKSFIPLIVRNTDPASAQAGTFPCNMHKRILHKGVAVASQVLCTSTTLNKRKAYVI